MSIQVYYWLVIVAMVIACNEQTIEDCLMLVNELWLCVCVGVVALRRLVGIAGCHNSYKHGQFSDLPNVQV